MGLRDIPERDKNGEPVNLWDAQEGRFLGQADYPARRDASGMPQRCCHTLGSGTRCPSWAALPFRMCVRHLETSDRLKVLGATRYETTLEGQTSKFRETFGHFMMDPGLSDLTPELALQRTLLQGVLDDALAGGDRVTREYVSALTHMIENVANLADRYTAIASRKVNSVNAMQMEAFVGEIIEALDAAVQHVTVRLLGGHKENESLIQALHDGILTTLADTLERTLGRERWARPALPRGEAGQDLGPLALDGGGSRGPRTLGAGGVAAGEGPEGGTD